MFGASIYAARIYNANLYGVVATVAAGSRGRRLVRWILSAPTIENPIGQWIRQREDEEILFL